MSDLIPLFNIDIITVIHGTAGEGLRSLMYVILQKCFLSNTFMVCDFVVYVPVWWQWIFLISFRVVSLALRQSYALRWRLNGRDSLCNHQPYDCLLHRLFRRRSKKTSKLHVTGLCVGNSPGTGEFPAQMASNAENVSIWWCHHGLPVLGTML